MRRNIRSNAAGLIVLMALAASGPGALAQGITGSAVTGTVSVEGGGPVEGASVQLRNSATGDAFTAVTGSSGRYFIDNVPPGGPYVLTAKASGFPPTTEGGIQLTLGERVTHDLVMRPLGEEIVVVGRARTQLDDRSRTGASTTIKDTQIAKLPLQGRNFTDLLSTSPQVSAGTDRTSMAGQNNRYNNIQIDGGANNDLFGLAASGTPGGQANAKPLSLEAIQEFVVQVAPFDVRQGSFAGGLVNAITKSGTNEFSGSVFSYYQTKALVGLPTPSDPNIAPVNSFNTWQFGGVVGGPIIKDKLHFFIATDIQARTTTFGSRFQISGTNPGDGAQQAGFTNADAQRFTDILANTYGITNLGDVRAPNLSNPDRNVFVKLSTSLIENSHLEVSYNFVNASDDILIRQPTSPQLPTPTSAGGLRDGYELSNSGYRQANTTNTGRVKLTSNWGDGKLSNEFLAGFSIIRDSRQLPTRVPLILVRAGRLGASDSWLAAGAERFSQSNVLDQDIYQVQDNLTFAIDNHRLTVGTSNEFLKIRNVFFQASIGAWAFDSLDAFAAGTPVAFQRRLPGSDLQEPGTAKFNVSQLGFYVQDEWSVLRNLTVTPGIRMDVPFLSQAPTNPFLVNNSAFPIDTSKVPSGNILWSPRLGLNWDIDGTAETIVRGGAGVFSGRPPYVWVSNAYSINGLSQIELTCVGPTGVPAFTTDPNAQPSSCPNPPPRPKLGEIDYFDPNTKYPQNLRVAVGVDRRLPWGLIGTADLLYTRDINGWYTTDENLNYLGTNGEGRAMYGRLQTTGTPPRLITTTSRIDGTNLDQAVKVFNKNGGRVYSATIQLQKQFLRRYAVSLGYTYSKSEDRISLTSSQALSNFRFSPLDGDIQNRNVRPSAFDRPHKITLTGTAALPFGFGVGLTYVGQSGLPYTWTVFGDANGDGISGNDLAFIPADPSQITLSGDSTQQAAQYAALQRFVDGQSCLREARGHFIQRGACRNPWQSFVNLRLTWTSPEVAKDQRFEVQFDIFNVMNLLNSSWGHFDQATPFENHLSSFLRVVGYDAVNDRPVYSFSEPTAVTTTVYSPTQSRWRMQLGARYLF